MPHPKTDGELKELDVVEATGRLSGEPNLRFVQLEAYANSEKKGFWQNANIGEKLMLIVSEVSEAMEAYRDPNLDPRKNYVIDGKPEGLGIELADAMIRIVDLANYLGLDMADLIAAKMKYNTTRPPRHGGKRA